MREVRKSIYNVSRPSHFGSIKKMPFNVTQQGKQNIEDAKRELTTWLEQNVDPLLQEEMREGLPKETMGSKYYMVMLDGAKGNELKAIGQKLPSGYLKEAFIKEYDLQSAKIEFTSGGLYLTFFIR